MNEAGVCKFIMSTTDTRNSGTLKFGILDIESEIVCSALSELSSLDTHNNEIPILAMRN